VLRFRPDDWLEGLLRPFVMLDPLAGVYFEDPAPDLRFAALIVLLSIAVVVALRARRWPAGLKVEPARLLLGILAVLYVWTFTIGNGRYFNAALLLVGPLLVLAWRLLPGSAAFRWMVLAGLVFSQVYMVQRLWEPNRWGMVHWQDGPGLPIEASSLREQPAVLLTITAVSYSLLVPRFHPQSRWANIAGQHEVEPGMSEYPRLRALLQSGLPMYVVVPGMAEYLDAAGQPIGRMREQIGQVLAPHALALAGQACSVLRSGLSARAPNRKGESANVEGFWVCPVRHAEDARSVHEAGMLALRRFDDVFERVEQRCPRFFPPGGGRGRLVGGVAVRQYTAADTTLYIDETGEVRYKYFRAMNATTLGNLDAVRGGAFEIECHKIPGRYRLPWQRD